QKAVLHGGGQMLSKKIMCADTGLQIVLESGAEVGTANAGSRNAAADIEERNPSAPDRKIVAQEGPNPQHVIGVGPVLGACKKLAQQLPIPPVPMLVGNHVRKNPSEIHAGQRQIMRLRTHQ